MYKKAGIADVKEFYAEKFAHHGNLDFTRNPLNFFEVDCFKYLWFFSQIAEGAKVLDFGCGSGALTCLKNRGCELTGLDLSPKALEIAKDENGYDHIFCGDLQDFPKKGYYDYVVSQDVFGHIPFEDKDATIEKLKSTLKPGGTMLHVIECGRVDYDAMSEQELTAFIKVDGHVGCEDKSSNIERFQKYFRHVDGEVRYHVVNSVEEYLKQAHEYGLKLNQTLLSYLELLDHDERRAFNISSGITMQNMVKFNYASPEDAGGSLFLRASDGHLTGASFESICLEARERNDDLVASDLVCCHGWYPAEKLGESSFRWAKSRAVLSLKGFPGEVLTLTLRTHYPFVAEKPVDVYFLAVEDHRLLKKVSLVTNEAVSVNISIDSEGTKRIEVFTELCWIPKLLLDSEDTRELGVGLLGLKLA